MALNVYIAVYQNCVMINNKFMSLNNLFSLEKDTDEMKYSPSFEGIWMPGIP